ncbi:MAG: hypothetical protein KJ646_03270 [Nanoarchaeota archaeon]|nr:hypothetical protein [Nanoarchaeota archaeon]
MGDEQAFSQSIEKCFNHVMGIYPLQNCFKCIPDEANKYCHKYDAMKIFIPVYRGREEYNNKLKCSVITLKKESALALKKESVIALKEKYPIMSKKEYPLVLVLKN